MDPSPLINKDSPFAFLQKQSAGGMQNTIDRTKIEKNWLQKKSSKEYPTFIYYAFELLNYMESFEKSDENSKEFLANRIKKLNRETIFNLVKNYEEMPQNQINKLREELLFEKLNNTKVFILQKLSSHFGNLLYRYISIDESSEKKQNDHQIKLLASKSIDSKPNLKQYNLPQKLIIQYKGNNNAVNDIHSNYEFLKWDKKFVSEAKYRIVLLYKEKKRNMAIYSTTQTDAQNILAYLIHKKDIEAGGQIKKLFQKIANLFYIKTVVKFYENNYLQNYALISFNQKKEKADNIFQNELESQQLLNQRQENISQLKKLTKELVFSGVQNIFIYWNKIAILNKETFSSLLQREKQKKQKSISILKNNETLKSLKKFFIVKLLSSMLRLGLSKKQTQQKISKYTLNFLILETNISIGFLKPLIMINSLKQNGKIALAALETKIIKKKNKKIIWEIINKDLYIEDDGEILIEVFDEGSEKQKEGGTRNSTHEQKYKVINILFENEICLPIHSKQEFIPIIHIYSKISPSSNLKKNIFNHKNNFILLNPKFKKNIFIIANKFDIDINKKLTNYEDIISLLEHKIKQNQLEMYFKSNFFFEKTFSNAINSKTRRDFCRFYQKTCDTESTKILNSGIPISFRRILWLSDFRLDIFHQIKAILNPLYLDNPSVISDENSVFKTLLSRSKELNFEWLFILLTNDLKNVSKTGFFDNDFLINNESLICDIFQTIFLSYELLRIECNYSKELLNILLNLILCLNESDPYDYIQLYSYIKENDIKSDIFWIFLSFIKEALIEIQPQQSKIFKSDLQGLSGSLLVLRVALKERFPIIKEIFDMGDCSPEPLELIFGEQYIQILGTFGFNHEFLFRLWDILFTGRFFKIVNQDKKKNNLAACISIFVGAALLTILKKTEFIVKSKNLRAFQQGYQLISLLYNDFDSFYEEFIIESMFLKDLITKKWYVWVDSENTMIHSFIFYDNFKQIGIKSLLNDEISEIQPIEMNLDSPINNFLPLLHIYIEKIIIEIGNPFYYLEIKIDEISKFYIVNMFDEQRNSKIIYEKFTISKPKNTFILFRIYNSKDDNNFSFENNFESINVDENKFKNLNLIKERQIKLDFNFNEFFKRILIFDNIKETINNSSFNDNIEISFFYENFTINEENNTSIHYLPDFLLKIYDYPTEEKNEILNDSFNRYNKILLKYTNFLKPKTSIFRKQICYEKVDFRIFEKILQNYFKNKRELRFLWSSFNDLSISENISLDKETLCAGIAFILIKTKGNYGLFYDYILNYWNSNLNNLKYYIHNFFKFSGIFIKNNELENFLDNYVFYNEFSPASSIKNVSLISEINIFDLTNYFIDYLNSKHLIYYSKDLWLDSITFKAIILQDKNFLNYYEENKSKINEYKIVLQFSTNFGINQIINFKINKDLDIINEENLIFKDDEKNIINAFPKYFPLENSDLLFDKNFLIEELFYKIPLINWFLSIKSPELKEYNEKKIIFNIYYEDILFLSLTVTPNYSLKGIFNEKPEDYFIWASKWSFLSLNSWETEKRKFETIYEEIYYSSLSPFASLKTWVWHIQILFFQICNQKNEEWDDNFGLFLKLKPNFTYLDGFTLFPNISIAYSNKLIENIDSPLYNIVSQNNSVINLMYFQNEIKNKNLISLTKKKCLTLFRCPAPAKEWLKSELKKIKGEKEFLIKCERYHQEFIINKKQICFIK